MNPKIKPVVYFCISAAVWAIPSYYLWGSAAGQVFFRLFGIVPAFFLQLCMFVPPVERWVRYVPIPGILGFGAVEFVIIAAQGLLGAPALISAAMFVLTPLVGFLLGWAAYKIYKKRKP